MVHLFFGCNIYGSVCVLIHQWLGFSFIAPEIVSEHLFQFRHMAWLPCFSHSFLKIIWLACVWVIWKARNNRVFNQKALDSAQLVDNVKLMSFSWLKANMHSFAFNYHDWWRHPLHCMGVMV